jgi:extracellular elastinolytic metalloproteinase
MESPNDGDRVVIENPADAVASPFGWHDTNGLVGPEFTITRGNNVNAYADTIDDEAPDPASQPSGGRGLNFNHPIPSYDASPIVYRDAAVDNLFYWNNVMHDVTFRYGFDEQAGNFQATNYSGLGRGGDDVQAEAQDGSGALNANFSTPPDGEPGRMQMYLWVDAFDSLGLTREDVVREYNGQVRDGDLDGGVIAHEYGHGISNRLVGGPKTVNCLSSHDEREGEGWSDWWSYVLTMRPRDNGKTPRGIGTYVVYHEGGRKADGIRITPYSTNMKVNPSTYETIKTAAEPHGVGYVWATMLWDLYWNLVEKHGFNPNAYEPWHTGGNNLAIQLVMDGMKFSVCEPGFEDARDAIIAADAALTGNPAKGVPGKNECLIWKTFARRGLGVNAKQGSFESKADGVDGFKVPGHCRK